jgi:4-diphosphocytidyl-2-C-methyl-D-erythritol kinase
VLPVEAELSAAEVYAEADRLGLPRETLDLARSLTRMQAALSAETILDDLHNDLQDAARSLCPAIDEALEAVLAAGADHALVSGSGPTALGVFVGSGHDDRARRVCDSIAAEGRTPAPVLARPAGPAELR